jgi:serine/threonine protein kinase
MPNSDKEQEDILMLQKSKDQESNSNHESPNNEAQDDSNNNELTGFTISAKGYTNFAERTPIDLTFTAYEKIGAGTFGMIHRIKYEGQNMALKIVHQDPDYCNRELNLLEQLRGNDNIVHLYYSYYTRFEGKIYLNLITELLSHSLFQTIYTKSNNMSPRIGKRHCSRRSSRFNANSSAVSVLPMYELRNCIRDMLLGLKFMHSKNIAHRDLKPENIGFAFDGTAKILDMGSAKKLEHGTRNSYEICTLLYRAPELLLLNQNYKCELDLWAVGCILAETINSSPLFFEADRNRLLMQIMSKMGRPPRSLLPDLSIHTTTQQMINLIPANCNFPHYITNTVVKLPPNESEYTNEVASLLLHLLVYDNRITAENALKLPWMTRTDIKKSTIKKDNDINRQSSKPGEKRSHSQLRTRTSSGLVEQ